MKRAMINGVSRAISGNIPGSFPGAHLLLPVALLLKDLHLCRVPNPVIHGISRTAASNKGYKQEFRVEIAGPGKRSGNKEEGVPGQRRESRTRPVSQKIDSAKRIR